MAQPNIVIEIENLSQQLTPILHAIALDLLDALQDKLNKNDLQGVFPAGTNIDNRHKHGKFTGNLQSSIRIVIKGNQISIYLPTYGKYLEYGTPNPTTPEEILPWVRSKLTKLKPSAQEHAAKRIAKHISLFGPRPFPFVRTTLHNDLPKILEKHLG